MSIEKMREEYKKHRSSIAAHLIQGDDWAGAYRLADQTVSLASFEAGWRASRAALAVNLPKPLPSGDYRMTVPFYKAADVIEALSAVGIEVKV
jgi:hypothetical protein